ncbi:MAG: hypothetical protein KatS3mg033_1510 [Thermonema sp.]|uniref:hypothetical protein n=1 Tax=Thermonema sp. TaxID=2231181 RepID=UPI0021DE138F|nr:hypothetical protein [Thermonema sp.]GIV39710.1 MAG: hypothetical protein KatS3mg033_1510 [Thermonema sp.]
MKFYNLLFIALLGCLGCNSATDERKAEEGAQEAAARMTAPELPVFEPSAAGKRYHDFAALLAAMPQRVQNDSARAIAGLPCVQTAIETMDARWQQLNTTYLMPLQQWAKQQVADLHRHEGTLFYPFSGPDILNAQVLFPACRTYVLVGLERPGYLPDDYMGRSETFYCRYFQDVERALEDLFVRNYFITSYMSSDLYRSAQGVLPLLVLFLVRQGNDILHVEDVYLENDSLRTVPHRERPDDRRPLGVKVSFKHPERAYAQTVYYFGVDLSDKSLQKKPAWVAFVKQQPNKIAYMKAASYVLFNPGFETVKSLLLDECSAIVQDDTGLRWAEWSKRKDWKISLYGKYARPIRDFGKYTYQTDLEALYDSLQPPALGFPYGYHWRDGNSSLLVGRRQRH